MLSKEAFLGFQPSSFIIFSDDTISIAGSPHLLAAISDGIICPVTFLHISITFLTLNPLHEYNLLHNYHL